MSNHGEKWKPVVGYEGTYSVSDAGRVMRTARGRNTRPGRVLAPATNHGGYRIVCLSQNGKERTAVVHSIVARAFLGDPHGLHVNHKDGDKQNNHVANLEHVTAAENNRHAVEMGLARTNPEQCRLAGRRNSTLTVADVRRIRRVAARGTSYVNLAREYGVHASTIGGIVRRERWQSVA